MLFPHQPDGANDHAAKMERLSVATPPDGAVFYSGLPETNQDRTENQRRAEAYVAVQPPGRAATLDQTEAGLYLAKVKATAEWDRLGRRASQRYAQAASGRVTCFVDGARPKSTFLTRELPALMKNRHVTQVNGLSADDLKKTYQRDKSEAFKHIEDKSRSMQPLPRQVTPLGKTLAHAPAQRPLSRATAGEAPVRGEERAWGRSR